MGTAKSPVMISARPRTIILGRLVVVILYNQSGFSFLLTWTALRYNAFCCMAYKSGIKKCPARCFICCSGPGWMMGNSPLQACEMDMSHISSPCANIVGCRPDLLIACVFDTIVRSIAPLRLWEALNTSCTPRCGLKGLEI